MKEIIGKADDKIINTMEINTKETELTDSVIKLMGESEDYELMEKINVTKLSDYKLYVGEFDIEIKEKVYTFKELSPKHQNDLVEIVQFNQQQNDVFEKNKNIGESLNKTNESYYIDDDDHPVGIG